MNKDSPFVLVFRTKHGRHAVAVAQRFVRSNKPGNRIANVQTFILPLFRQVRMPIWYVTCLCMSVWSFTHAYPYWVSFTLLSSSLGWQAAPISAQLREIILRLLSK